jgi:hypothetical protein
MRSFSLDHPSSSINSNDDSIILIMVFCNASGKSSGNSLGNSDFAKAPASRIDFKKRFGILLNNGYSYIGVKSVSDLLKTLKGIDLQIYSDLLPLIQSGTHTLRVIPVLVDNYTVLSGVFARGIFEHGYDYHGGYDDDSDYDFSSFPGAGMYGMRKSCYPTNREIEYSGKTKDVDHLITIYNVPDEFITIINTNMRNHRQSDDLNESSDESELFCKSDNFNDLPIVYYLGSGYRFFKIDKRGVHTGNESNGWVLDQIYFNFMLEYVPCSDC